MIDWNKTLFRASSWGNLMSEPVSKADKEAGKLSLTCQKELIKIYNEEKYGRKKDITTKQMSKGTLCEDDSITLYSRVEGQVFVKNEERITNEYFTGHPDLFVGTDIYHAERVDDIKSSWELDTFTPKLIETLDRSYECQLNVYFDLTGASFGSIAYCLVDCPPEILMGEQRKLLYSMNVISEEAPDYIEASEELERTLTFPDIDYRERVIKIPCYRNDELIQKMKSKVPILRQWLSDFEQKHLNQYPK